MARVVLRPHCHSVTPHLSRWAPPPKQSDGLLSLSSCAVGAAASAVLSPLLLNCERGEPVYRPASQAALPPTRLATQRPHTQPRMVPTLEHYATHLPEHTLFQPAARSISRTAAPAVLSPLVLIH